jgi:hypothetical protein
MSREKQFKKEISSLKKDLLRKEKALAETSALLVLKKSPGNLGGTKGRMIKLEDKQTVLQLISEACESGPEKARLPNYWD